MKEYSVWFIISVSLMFVSCRDRKSNPDNNTHQVLLASDTATINASNRLATTLFQKNNDSAILLLNRSLEQSERINYPNGMANAYEFLGVAYFYKYQYDTSVYLQNKAYEIFQKTGNKNGMALVQYSLSYNYSLMHDMQKSLECIRKSRELYEQTKNYRRIYDCIEGLIYINKQLHNTPEVDSLIKELIVVAEENKDKTKMANSYYTLGNHYIDNAYLNLAIEAFYKALSLAEESGDTIEKANALGGVGLANLYLKDYEKAINYYLQQEKILRNLNKEYELSITYTNIGEAYNSLNDYVAALGFHKKALSLREKMNFQLARSNSLHNIAYTYYLMKDSADNALKYIERALDIDKEIRNYDGFAKNYMLLGKMMILKNKRQAGIRYLEQSLTLAQKYNNTSVILETTGALSKLYADEGNFAKAFACLVINNEINDSMVSGNTVKRITQLEMQHDFDRKQNETEVTHLKERLQFETTLRRNRLLFVFAIIIGSLIIATGTVIYFSYVKSRKADKEKEALLKEIHHRVKNNLMVISSLLNLQSASIHDDTTKNAVRESQSRVKSMALIHQLLYQSERFTSIDFPKYLEQLMASLQSTYRQPGRNVEYIIQAEDLKIDIDTAIPLGLITNELATNAYKYAFTDSIYGRIKVDLSRTKDHKCLLQISDNGKGLPADFDLESSSTLGLKLVKILTKQIKAKMNYSNLNGTEFSVIFSENL